MRCIMYSRVLVAVDGSFTSTAALQAAAPFAGSGTQLRIVTVAENPEFIFDSPYSIPCDLGTARQAVIDEATTALQQARSQLRAAGIEAEARLIDLTHTQNRNIARAILCEAQNWNADLLVLGTHGRRGVRRLLLGSVAEQITRTAPCPILLVRGIKESLSEGINPANVYSDWPEDEVIGG